MFRIGLGLDSHRLVPGRKLILGGIQIENDLGLDGHSDADIVLHSLIDALLGASALGDIGYRFSDQKSEYKDIDSKVLLGLVLNLLKKNFGEFRIINVDITIVAQRPRLAPYILRIRQNLADLLDCDLSQISVKAKTAEMMGAIGRGEGMQAHTICLLEQF